MCAVVALDIIVRAVSPTQAKASTPLSPTSSHHLIYHQSSVMHVLYEIYNYTFCFKQLTNEDDICTIRMLPKRLLLCIKYTEKVSQSKRQFVR